MHNNVETGTCSCLILIILSVAIGCKHNRKAGDEVHSEIVNVNFGDVAPDAYFPWSSIIDSVGVIPLETKEESLVSEISKIEIRQGRIVIYDLRQKDILIFDVTGKFVSKLVRGKGPQEIIECRDFIIDKEGFLRVLSFNEIVLYDLNGKFVSKNQFNFLSDEYPINPTQFTLAGEEGYFLWNGTFGIEAEDLSRDAYFLLYKTNKDLDRVTQKYFIAERKTLESGRFRMWNNKNYLAPRLTGDTIYKVDSQTGKVNSEFLIDLGDNALSKHLSSVVNKGESRIYYEMNESSFCGNIRDISMTDECMFFAYNCSKYVYQALYLKSKKKSINGKAYGFDELIKFVRIRNSYNNRIVFDYEMPELRTAYIAYSKDSSKAIPLYQRVILNKIKNLDVSDNPVVCIARLKLN